MLGLDLLQLLVAVGDGLREGLGLLEILVFVHHGVYGVRKWSAERSRPQIGRLVLLVIELLFAMRGRQSLPREGIDEQGMLLEILLESILLREDTSTVGITSVIIVVAFLYAVAVVVAVDVVVDAIDVGAPIDVGGVVLLKQHQRTSVVCVVVLSIVFGTDIEIIIVNITIVRNRLYQIWRFSVLSILDVVQLLV